MLIRVLKILILIGFLTRLSTCRYRDVAATRITNGKSDNDRKEFPNLLLQQKEREGVSGIGFLQKYIYVRDI